MKGTNSTTQCSKTCWLAKTMCRYTIELVNKYHIIMALIFRGSKFSQIAALKEFVEKISQIRVSHVCYSTVAKILVE